MADWGDDDDDIGEDFISAVVQIEEEIEKRNALRLTQNAQQHNPLAGPTQPNAQQQPQRPIQPPPHSPSHAPPRPGTLHCAPPRPAAPPPAAPPSIPSTLIASNAASVRPIPSAPPPRNHPATQIPAPPAVTGRISAAAARILAQGWGPREGNGGTVAPPSSAAAAPLQPTAPIDPNIEPSARMQQRIRELEGTVSLLRGQVNTAEHQAAVWKAKSADLERRSGGSVVSSGGPLQQAATVAQLQQELIQTKQQLMFKDQELKDAKRRQQRATSIALAAPLPPQPPTATAGTGSIAAANAEHQQHERTCSEPQSLGEPTAQETTAPRPAALIEANRQHQEVQQRSPERSKRRVDGSIARVQCTSRQEPEQSPPIAIMPPPPLLPIGSSTAIATSSFQSAAATVSRLWASCHEDMTMLQTGEVDALKEPVAQGPASTVLAWAATAAAAAPRIGNGSGHRLRSRSTQIENLRRNWALNVLPKVSAGLASIESLLQGLAGLVACACANANARANEREGQESQRTGCEDDLSLAAAALNVMACLVRHDEKCQSAALASCGCPARAVASAASPSARITFSNASRAAMALNSMHIDTQSTVEGGNGHAPGNQVNVDVVGSALTAACRPAANALQQCEGFEAGNDAAVKGLLALCLLAALVAQRLPNGAPVHRALISTSCELSLALVAAADQSTQRHVFLPLLTGDLVLASLKQSGPSRPAAVLLLHLLLQNARLQVAFVRAMSPPSDPQAAAGARPKAATSTGTPVTRAAAARDRAATSMDIDIDIDIDDDNAATTTRADDDRKNHGRWAGAPAVLDALLACLVLDNCGENPCCKHDDETRLARTALAALAVLLDAQADACMLYLIASKDEPTPAPASAPGALHRTGSLAVSTGGGSNDQGDAEQNDAGVVGAVGSLPSQLVHLAEAGLRPGSDDVAVMLLSPEQWPEGVWPSAMEAQARWHRRLRMAQEALTLLRGMILSMPFAAATLDELSLCPASTQRMLTALGRLSRVECPPGSETGGGALAALPVAAWAHAIGTSTNLASLGEEAMARRRGGLPCCSARDVCYLAKGVRLRMLHRLQK